MNGGIDRVGGSHARPGRPPDGTRGVALSCCCCCPGERRLARCRWQRRRECHGLRGGRLAEQLGQLSRFSYKVGAVLGTEVVRRRRSAAVEVEVVESRHAGPFARTSLDSCHGSRGGSRTCVRGSHISRKLACRPRHLRYSLCGLKKDSGWLGNGDIFGCIIFNVPLSGLYLSVSLNALRRSRPGRRWVSLSLGVPKQNEKKVKDRGEIWKMREDDHRSRELRTCLTS